MIKFSVWLEQKDYIEDTILGVFGGDFLLGDKEKDYLKQRNTNEFSNEILKKTMNLGIIKAIAEDNPNKYIDIKNSIKRGLLIKDLVDKIRETSSAPKAKLESITHPLKRVGANF